MARTGAKAWITRRLPPDLERSLYVWIASVLFLAVCWRLASAAGRDLGNQRCTLWTLFIIQMIGVVLSVRAAGVVGVWELAGVRQPDYTRPVEFKTSGPFAIVRHPIYLGLAPNGLCDPRDDDEPNAVCGGEQRLLDRRNSVGRSNRWWKRSETEDRVYQQTDALETPARYLVIARGL